MKQLLLVLALSVSPAVRLSAQCPDGSPPPCQAVAAAAVRRPNPPLDARTWIVLPFENVSASTDIDWLRSASVNLLYLDMSRWRDVRVIDDERVADLLREVPEARGAQLALQAGLAVARRAGAGKLVMGDLLKVGARTQIVAKVFDVRTGQRVRSVREETANADSLMGIFGRLARGILNAPPPPGTTLGAAGTTSLEAYQEYIAGVAALNTWDLGAARQRFSRAITLDSAFALAHYKLSMVIGWENPTDAQHLTSAEAAQRSSGGLPPRERALINGQLLQGLRRYGESCDTYRTLIRTDSADVEAWYNLGECSFHDNLVVPQAGDSTRMVFRSSWNTAVQAFARSLELDPTYHLAFQHIQDVLLNDQRTGCALGTTPACERPYIAFLRRDGDSLIQKPVSASSGPEAVQERIAAAASNSRRRNLEAARALAERWLQVGPTERRARIAYARSLLRLGDLDGAEANFALVPPGSGTIVERYQFFSERVDLALKRGRSQEARRLMDSAFTAGVPPQAAQGFGLLSVVVGRFRRFDSLFAGAMPAPPPVRAYFAAAVRTVAGAPPENLTAAERDFAGLIGVGPGAAVRSRVVDGMALTLIWGIRQHRPGTWALWDTANVDPRIALGSWFAVGDTNGARRALRRLDSTLARLSNDIPDGGVLLLSADAHLSLGDSAVALERLRAAAARIRYAAVLDAIGPGVTFAGFLWGRTWLDLADLASARGEPDVARGAYQRVVDLWADGDSDVQPLVARARRALAALGP
jgi:eukaryotic-like serine/threonine-protein kinase